MMWNANFGGPSYGFTTYGKTPLMLSMLGGIVGDDNVQKAMSNYAKVWAFKHPSPWDYIFFMNAELKQDLNWFWYYWLWTTESVDGKIEDVTTAGTRTTVVVRQDGQMPSPVVLRVTLADQGGPIKAHGERQGRRQLRARHLPRRCVVQRQPLVQCGARLRSRHHERFSWTRPAASPIVTRRTTCGRDRPLAHQPRRPPASRRPAHPRAPAGASQRSSLHSVFTHWEGTMKRAVLVGAAAAALMSVGLYAQGRNFSGTWTIDSEKTTAANAGMAGGGGRGGGTIAATSGERRVVDPAAAGAVAVGGGGARGGGGGAVVARSGAAGGAVAAPAGTTITLDTKSFTVSQGEMATAYALDGSVTDISNARRKATAKASWQGDKLVIETTAEGPNGPVVSLASWYLDGESLVRENSSTGPDGEAITRKTYFKKG